MSAVVNDDIDGVKFFVKSNRSDINRKNIGGATALHIAARLGNYEIVKILLENSANVNMTDNEGWTSLMRASLAANPDVIQLLLNNSANPTYFNSFSESVIMHAAMSDCDSCLKVMFFEYDFINKMNTDLLLDQLRQAFIIAKKHNKQETQAIIEAYLDEVKRSTMKMNTFEIGTTEDIEQNQVKYPKKLKNAVSSDGSKKFVFKKKTPAQKADLVNKSSESPKNKQDDKISKPQSLGDGRKYSLKKQESGKAVEKSNLDQVAPVPQEKHQDISNHSEPSQAPKKFNFKSGKSYSPKKADLEPKSASKAKVLGVIKIPVIDTPDTSTNSR